MVAAAALKRPEIESVARQAREECGQERVLPLIADVTKEEDCGRIVEEALKRFGRPLKWPWRSRAGQPKEFEAKEGMGSPVFQRREPILTIGSRNMKKKKGPRPKGDRRETPAITGCSHSLPRGPNFF